MPVVLNKTQRTLATKVERNASKERHQHPKKPNVSDRENRRGFGITGIFRDTLWPVGQTWPAAYIICKLSMGFAFLHGWGENQKENSIL